MQGGWRWLIENQPTSPTADLRNTPSLEQDLGACTPEKYPPAQLSGAPSLKAPCSLVCTQHGHLGTRGSRRVVASVCRGSRNPGGPGCEGRAAARLQSIPAANPARTLFHCLPNPSAWKSSGGSAGGTGRAAGDARAGTAAGPGRSVSLCKHNARIEGPGTHGPSRTPLKGQQAQRTQVPRPSDSGGGGTLPRAPVPHRGALSPDATAHPDRPARAPGGWPTRWEMNVSSRAAGAGGAIKLWRRLLPASWALMWPY